MDKRITIHGYERLKARTNSKGKRAELIAVRAWEKGKVINSFVNPRFRKYLTNLTNNSKDPDREIRVFGGSVYVFNKSGMLITVLIIPEKIKRGLVKKKNERKNYYYDED